VERDKIGSPHPLLSPSVIPLPFSWLALFGHVTAAIAGGQTEREGKKGGRMDRLFFFSFFSFCPLRTEGFGLRDEVRKVRTLREESLMKFNCS